MSATISDIDPTASAVIRAESTSPLLVEDCQFLSASADYLHLVTSQATIRSSTFTSNMVSARRGLVAEDSRLDVANSTFEGFSHPG